MKKIKGVSKVFSLLLIVVMLNTLLWVPSVSATTGHSMVSHGCNTGSSTTYLLAGITQCTVTDVRGFGGKSNNDLSVKIEANKDNAASAYLQGNVSMAYNPITTDTDNVYICSFNLYPVTGLNTVKIATTQSAVITPDIPGAALEPNQWNRIVCVYDRTQGEYGTNTMFVNGMPYGAPRVLAKAYFDRLHNDGKSTVYRAMMNLDSGGEAYIDDFIVWKAPRETAEPYTGVPHVSDELVFGNTIIPGTSLVQVREMATGGPGNTVTVKAYRGGDMSQEPLEENAVLENGDTVFLEECIHARDDAAPDKIRMAYNYYQVSKTDKLLLYDLEKQADNAYNKVRCTVAKDVPGFYGKREEEKVLRVTRNAAADTAGVNTAFLDSTTNADAFQASGKYPVVFECDFLPESHVESVFLTTGVSPGTAVLYPADNAAHPESVSSYNGERTSGFMHGRWSKLKLVADYGKNTVTTYLDGVKVGSILMTPSATWYENFKKQIRLVVKWDDSGVDASEKKFCVDNFRVYEWIDPEPEAEAIALANIADNYLRHAENISFFDGKITDDAKTEMGVPAARAYESESNYNSIADGGSLSDDNLVVLRNDEGSYGYYTVREHLLTVGGDAYVTDTVYTKGELNFTAIGGGTIFLAQFDSKDNLLKVQVQPLTDSDCVVTLEPAEGMASVKAMLWNSAQNLVPYTKEMELSYNPNYNKAHQRLSVLMIGNSFSVDMSEYLRDIAAQNNEKVTVGILNKGGASALWHAQRIETDNPSGEGIGFTYNGKTSSFINLKTALSDYDWDIVVLQNWSGAGWNYGESDDAYVREWQEPFTTLANYVKENEPDAKIMIQETWAYEQGYNNTNRTEMLGQNQRIYNRIAEDLQETLGYKPELIRSGDVFGAAIAYEKNGVQIFNTTYDASKHQFAGGKDYSVGDGSSLLSDADAAAGKITLHRDGFHAGHAGRYLLAANAYATIFNKTVSGNPFCPGTMRYAVGAVDLTDGSAAFLNYDSLDKEVVKTLQQIVDDFHNK